MHIGKAEKLIKSNAFTIGINSGILIYVFCCIFGVTSPLIFSDTKLIFFMGSIVFALTAIYFRTTKVNYEDISKEKKKNFISKNKGMILVIAYTIIYGAGAIILLRGIELSVFMLSYVFAIAIFYMRSPERINKVEIVVNDKGEIQRTYVRKSFKGYLNNFTKSLQKKEFSENPSQ